MAAPWVAIAPSTKSLPSDTSPLEAIAIAIRSARPRTSTAPMAISHQVERRVVSRRHSYASAAVIGAPSWGAWCATNSSVIPVASRNASSRVASRTASSCTLAPCSCAMSPICSRGMPVTTYAPASRSSVPGTTWAPRVTSAGPSRSMSGLRSITARRRLVLMKSSTGPLAISAPRPMTTSRSAISAISASRWLDTKTERPPTAKPFSSARSHWMPCGSRPLAGSSRMRVCGSPSRAAAMPSRCPMPRLNFFGLPLATVDSPTSSSTSSTRRSDTPLGAASRRRWLRADRVGWNGLASSSAPTWRIGIRRERNGVPSNVVAPSPLSRPSISRMVVDLPDPLGPRKPVTLPGSTRNDRSSTACLDP